MGAFLSHLAKALLIITLLAWAGAVQPIPDSPTAAATGPPVQPPAAGGPPVPSPAPDVPADAPEAAPAPPGEPPGHGAEPHAGSVSPDPINRLPTEARQVVLTIDDGPSGLTGQFLEVLAAEDVPAVFFWVTGSRQLPLAAEVIGQGHQLGTHTVSHPRLPQLPPEEAAAQIVHSKAALEDAAGAPVRFFRPPYGEHNRQIRDTAARHGLATVLWNVDSRDWALAEAPDQIVANVMAQVRPGAIILIHERRQTLDVLPALIRALREAGYTFVPLPEPVPLPGPEASAD